jgi:hypothetical protein
VPTLEEVAVVRYYSRHAISCDRLCNQEKAKPNTHATRQGDCNQTSCPARQARLRRSSCQASARLCGSRGAGVCQQEGWNMDEAAPATRLTGLETTTDRP